MLADELCSALSAYQYLKRATPSDEHLHPGPKTPAANHGYAWRRYHSIEKDSSEDFLRACRLQVACTNGAESEWIASEKVHGANFCLETDGFTVEYASRTSKLGSGAGFLNTELTMPAYHEFAKEAFRLAKQLHADLRKLLIYGEYFGGYYPGHKPAPGSRTVQKGVAYSPGNHFYAFDVSLDGAGYMDFDGARSLLLAAGFSLVAAPLFRGSLDDMLSIDVESFKTTLPLLLGHPPLDRFQIAEGLVIRPVREVMWGSHRAILKKKARAFWEVTNQAGMAMKVAKERGDKDVVSLDQMAFEAAKGYVNENRILSVISKDPDLVQNSQEHKLAGLLTKDAWEDFEKEHAGELPDLGKAVATVRKALFCFSRVYVAQHIARIRADLR